MKNLIYISLIGVLTLGLTACGGKDKRASVRVSDRDKRTGGNLVNTPERNQTFSNINSNNSSLRGTINTDQERIDAFVSAMGQPDQIIGLISGAGTGVYFAGQAKVSGQQITSAAFVLEVQDDLFVNKTESKAFRIETLDYIVGSGSINAQESVVMEFKDSFQKVKLVGNVQGSTFSGVIEFVNYQDYAGESPWQGELGTFSIPTCSFFDCQNQ